MSEQDDIQRGERIEAYVSGKLVGLERARFEDEVARDAELRDDVELAKLLRDAVKNEEVMRFRDRVREVTEEQEALVRAEEGAPVVPIQRSRTWAYLAAAASVALVVTFAWWQWDRQPQYAELAMAYANDTRSATRGDSSTDGITDEDVLDNARDLLALKRPDEALRLIKDVSFAAPCTEARRVWLMALAHLMKDQVAEARTELHDVASSGCMVKQPAQELLDEL